MKIQVTVNYSDINPDLELFYSDDFNVTIEVDFHGGEIEYLQHCSSHKLDSKVIENYAETNGDFYELVEGAKYEADERRTFGTIEY